MRRVVSAIWKKSVKAELDNRDPVGGAIAHSKWEIGFNPASQWLIIELMRRRIYYKVFNAGAGVKVISTDVVKCPCCTRKF